MNHDESIENVLGSLKDFQRRTVDYTFRRMFEDAQPARRFLVADEVGLGKTMVARGVIARAIQHLRGTLERINVIYVCSNADIAAQNVRRLNISGQPAFVKATRLTLLPLEFEALHDSRLNFISFTPGTTFEHGQRGGQKLERMLIYQMLMHGGRFASRGLCRLLQLNAGDGWFEDVKTSLEFDENIARSYRDTVLADPRLAEELTLLADIFHDGRRTIDAAIQQRRLAVVGDLRKSLAKCCLDALTPNLVILDEFQRFRDLLDAPEDNPAAELAHALFNYSDDLRVLLLSATPYKMYASDLDEEDHYRDFLGTLGFLFDDTALVSEIEGALRAFRQGLLSAQDEAGLARLDAVKRRIESMLKQVMCRTERVNATHGQDAMVAERLEPLRLETNDLRDWRMLDRIATHVGAHEPMEYWKSSPYLLNFMKGYVFKDKTVADFVRTQGAVSGLVSEGSARLLRSATLDEYGVLDPANPRLRLLVDEIERLGLWRMLWMPPSLAYWKPEGAYEGEQSVSKTLVFSSWNMVPDAIAAALSYVTERQMLARNRRELKYESMPRQLTQRLRFSRSGDGRYHGMMALALMYPSPTLAEMVDPLTLALDSPSRPTFDQVRAVAAERLRTTLTSVLPATTTEGSADRRWYWAALAMADADRYPAHRAWCATQWAKAKTDDDAEASGGFAQHVEHWLEAWDGRLSELGRMPDDLFDILADLALSGHAVCAMRALRRPTQITWADTDLLTAAGRVAEGLRSQFNAPAVIGLLQSDDADDSYWQRVLHYGADGNLQAVLDEYAHGLLESLGLTGASAREAVAGIGNAMFDAMSIRTSLLRPDELDTTVTPPEVRPFSMRCHYALRFGKQDQEDSALARKDVVRAAFNSPFRPFVLASTSVGQEGLDFHTWCHSLVHWNLPSNPVDLEQREGRVHRYKGYAVRKNVARAFGLDSLRSEWREGADPWECLFDLARTNRDAGASDLVPYWIYEPADGVKVERRVFTMPYSKEEQRYRRVQKSLVLYRMVFGQPRQDDLLEHLVRQFGEHQARKLTQRWRVDLAPPGAEPAPARGHRYE
ncbi:helicase-related protein [Cupriavidus necator]|uniref:DEAD/DEAH box helicase n=1 Tax=Cupriavidus necator TaxID=106590 RepID=UPI003ECF0A7E